MSTADTGLQKRITLADYHLKELETLYRISQILAEVSGQKQTLSAILDVLESELGMKGGTVTLLSPDGNEIMIEVANNLSEQLTRSVRYRMGEGITGRVVQTGEAMIVPKASQEPMFLNRSQRKKDTKEEISFICVPVAIGQKVIGAISADRVFKKDAPLEEDKRVLSIIASMIAHDVRARREAARQQQTLEDENLRLRNELEDRFRPENIIGNSNAMRQVYREIHQVAHSDTTVLIRGGSGS